MRRRLVVSLALSSLACATGSSAAPQTTAPETETPSEATTDTQDTSTPKSWGQVATRTEVEGKPCMSYEKLVVLLDEDELAISFEDASSAPGCAMTDAAVRIDVDDLSWFYGVVNDLVVVRQPAGSEFVALSFFDASGESIFDTVASPPSATLEIDYDAGVLVYGDMIDHPCPQTPDDPACWAEFQTEHPVLKDEAPPAVNCGPDIEQLLPYVVLHYEVPLDDLEAEPVERLPLSWGCI